MNNQWFPAIYESIAVWQDYGNGNQDIYWYSISTREKSQITADKSDKNLLRW